MTDYSKCTITRYPTPVLTERARPVEVFDDNLRVLAERMIEIMVETSGVGLAGPQAGVNLRIFVASIDGTQENAKVYVNPTIKVEGPIVSSEEGCLSLPGLSGKIKRYDTCTITAQDLNGNEFTETGEGLQARIYQHEYDHLEGRMIKDRLGTAAKIRAKRRLKQLEEEYEQTHNENS
ncbi:MAG: peptide deformylase [Planctomycetota bacterium]|jgi:peptide deformylase